MIYILGYDFDDEKISKIKSKIKDKIIKRDFDYFETRTCSEEEFNERHSENEGVWLSKGIDHTILKNGWIRRTYPNQRLWSIDINDNHDIIELISEFGKIECHFSKQHNYIPYISLDW